MALRAVPDHPKFADLKQRLGVPKYAALGLLESLWHFCGRFTPQGNIGKYPDSTIEAWIEWNGEAGAAITALCGAGWVDANPTHRLLVHDWEQHADKATKQALSRAHAAFCVPSVCTVGIQNAVLSSLPVPVPVPESVPEPVPASGNKPMMRPNGISEFPLTIAEIRKHDPAVDETFVRALVIRTFNYCQSSSNFPPDKLEKLTDKNIARLVAESYRTWVGKNGHGTGLLLSRVPPIAVTWAQEKTA